MRANLIDRRCPDNNAVSGYDDHAGGLDIECEGQEILVGVCRFGIIPEELIDGGPGRSRAGKDRGMIGAAVLDDTEINTKDHFTSRDGDLVGATVRGTHDTRNVERQTSSSVRHCVGNIADQSCRAVVLWIV